MHILNRLVADETAAETTEYAMILGIIVLGSATMVSAAGGSVSNWWGIISTTFVTLFGTP